MTYDFSRRRFLTGAQAFVLTGVASGALARAPEVSKRPVARGEAILRKAQTPIEKLIETSRLGGRVGFCAADAKTGKIIEAHLEEMGQPPASVAKAMTAAYALDVLGPTHRFATKVMITGEVVDGAVQGDLILAGGGDPVLDTDNLAELAAKLRAAGITSVAGDYRVWGGAFPYVPRIDEGQPDHVGYSPSVSGLNLNFNRVHFEWRRQDQGSYAVTMQARSASYRPDVRIARMAIAPRKSPVYTYADREGRDEWTVAQGALGKEGARWLPVRKPELYAGEIFHSFARSQGIKLDNPGLIRALPEGATEIVRVESAPLDVILKGMLKHSTNLTAEAVGLAASSKRRGTRPDGLEASAAEMNAWAKARFGLGDVAFVDHSGLGERSRISARDMMTALAGLYEADQLRPLLKPFPMRDAQRRILRDHPLKVQAKTGTLNFVSGLAGYVEMPGGEALVFAIFAADLERRAGLTRAQRERPEGARSWNTRAKILQNKLIERWAVLHGTG